MSLTIKLASTPSDSRTVTKKVTTIAELTGNLKNDTSIIDPVIIIECDASTINSVNYLVIDDFKRSYFIKDIKSIRKNVWEITCHVDVLSSFSQEILKCTAIVRRQEEKWNLYLNDDSFRCYQNPYIIQKEFPMGFTPGASSYVLLVAGQPHPSQTEEEEEVTES